ncbi:hypothetical protein D3C86_2215560 [compost metagenome]
MVFYRIDLGGTWLLLTQSNYGTTVPKIGTTAAASYSQADTQAVIDKLNSIIDGLRATGIFRTS